jgi:hemerythrin-like domain-containing protein
MEIMRVLTSEHRTIMTTLGLLERVGLSVLASDTQAVRDLASLLAFLRDFLVEGHLRREESVLFPLMRQCGMAWESGPLKLLAAEHEAGRLQLQRMQRLLGELDRGEEGVRDQIFLEIRSYRGQMEAHIRREDQVIFPMLQRLIPRVGAAREAAWKAWLHELSALGELPRVRLEILCWLEERYGGG